jgi:hypothetical protein
MAETGLENLIRGDGSSSNAGCVGPAIASLVFMLVLLVGLGLLASYCSPAPADNSNQESTHQR